MLDGGIIQRLLEEKWKTFARVLDNITKYINLYINNHDFILETVFEASTNFIYSSDLFVHGRLLTTY